MPVQSKKANYSFRAELNLLEHACFTLSDGTVGNILAVGNLEVRVHVPQVPLEGLAPKVLLQLKPAVDAERRQVLQQEAMVIAQNCYKNGKTARVCIKGHQFNSPMQCNGWLNFKNWSIVLNRMSLLKKYCWSHKTHPILLYCKINVIV